MGQALITGLIAQGVRPRNLLAADPSGAARARLQALGVRATGDNCVVACEADVIVLAVKPQEMASVLEDIRRCLTPRQLVISIAAGITLRYLRARLPKSPVIRVMPNLAATVRKGFAAYACGRSTTPRHRAVVQAVLGAVGEAVELPERLLDAVTAVSGSGPAYVFLLAQMWEAAAVALGLPAAVAKRAVRQTLAGSVELLAGDRLTPQEWIARVASKKGTTETALRVLAKRKVGRHFAEALRAAVRRSRALSKS
jgi:pyrroline-5-carboxylate reductase